MLDALTLFPIDTPAARAPDPRPMIVDSFAGGGGASTGIELALGRSPDIAINHSEAALALHAANHPETLHLSENVYRVDPLTHMHGRHIGLMWFSPDCKHFSKAKGGAPVKRNIRDLAWIIPGWIERIQKSGGRVDVVLLENVEEFRTWGPLIETDKGLMPCPDRRGETFAAWCKALRRLGGRIQWREMRACDYGAPTIRKRLFVVVRFDREKIVWPAPTHGDPESDEVRKGKLKPWRTAAECIDWSLPCPSIFDTSADIMAKHGLRAVRPLKPNTLARVARGIHRYVLEAAQPYLVNLTHGGRLEDLAAPIRTITGAHRGEKALVAPSITRFNGGATGTDLRAPMATVTANSWIKKPGGAAPYGLLAPCLASIAHGYSGGRREYPLTDPLGTITVGGVQHAVIAPTLANIANGKTTGRGPNTWPVAAPLRTITSANGHAVVAPILSQMYGSGGGNGDLRRPHPVVTAEGQHSSVIAPVLTYAQQGGASRPITAPHHTICASNKDQNAVMAATMIQTGYGEPAGQAPRALDIRRPLGTVVAGGQKHAPIAAFLAQQNNDSRRVGGVNPGRPADAPMATICQSGSHQTPVAAFFAKYYGTGDGARTDEPCHTITTRDRMAHCEASLAAPPFGPEHHAKARDVAQLLRDHGLWDDREFVTLTVEGAEFVIVDIGMRMLTPRELFTAQGFPPDYVIEGVWEDQDSETPTFRAFPKDVQVSCCGNSVCPPLAEALVRANCGHLAVDTEVRTA
ncbi:DNA (cytosine-5)-methyltransferase 1 [Gemmobacter caeni]|uniref:DNA (cytosine-5-)-methyltransferase n=1 Tax=Gemmobacter caeni TaxID=589035 RepID=A0A2T6ART9_9RHOB|nr:DNA cytosine methyltransferase [Gemmobacter caeni]PTX46535.1 DNA (cytosine-5)-methyltransferase 1 [Gemmobacter caeni]TWI95384.1 DNA (cytosine-5)-methyltransferase 1 [Gemmobacter caeni]